MRPFIFSTICLILTMMLVGCTAYRHNPTIPQGKLMILTTDKDDSPTVPAPADSHRPEAIMPDRDARAKLRIYQAIYRLNLSFANIVANCRALRESGILGPKDTRLYQSFAQELQAEINSRLAGILESDESDDHARFGKVRDAYEKELRDPDDVFIHAEERRRETRKTTQETAALKSGKTLRTQQARPAKQNRPHLDSAASLALAKMMTQPATSCSGVTPNASQTRSSVKMVLGLSGLDHLPVAQAEAVTDHVLLAQFAVPCLRPES